MTSEESERLEHMERILRKVAAETVQDLEAKLEELAQNNMELEASFDLRHKADMRAIARWRAAAPGRELILPDHADLCVWLLEQLEENHRLYRNLLSRSEALAGAFRDAYDRYRIREGEDVERTEGCSRAAGGLAEGGLADRSDDQRS